MTELYYPPHIHEAVEAGKKLVENAPHPPRPASKIEKDGRGDGFSVLLELEDEFRKCGHRINYLFMCQDLFYREFCAPEELAKRPTHPNHFVCGFPVYHPPYMKGRWDILGVAMREDGTINLLGLSGTAHCGRCHRPVYDGNPDHWRDGMCTHYAFPDSHRTLCSTFPRSHRPVRSVVPLREQRVRHLVEQVYDLGQHGSSWERVEETLEKWLTEQ